MARFQCDMLPVSPLLFTDSHLPYCIALVDLAKRLAFSERLSSSFPLSSRFSRFYPEGCCGGVVFSPNSLFVSLVWECEVTFC